MTTAKTSVARQRDWLLGRLSRRTVLKSTLAAGVTLPTLGSAAVSSVLAQDQATSEAPSGTLIASASGDPLSFNPNFQADDNQFVTACNIYNSLMSLNGDYEIIPELAESWEFSEDGLSMTFHLVQNASWHDGEPFTAHDVRYTLEEIVNTPTATASGLIGAIDSVEVVDDYTAVAHLSRPSVSLAGFLSWYGIFILPAHIYEGTDWTTNPANQAPIGTGPFKFVNYSAGSTIELEANLDYWGEGPYVERFVQQIIPDANTAVQALLNGEIDVMASPQVPSAQVETIRATPGLKIAEKEYPTVYQVFFNHERETTGNVDVRRAISAAVNREQILSTALGGVGDVVTTYYPPAIEWAANFAATAPEYDPEAAAALLDEAGFPLVDDSRMTLSFVYFTAGPQWGDVATVIREQLAAVGIDLELVALEIGAWGDRVEAGDFDLCLLAGFQGPDPANMRRRVATGEVGNVSNYSSAEIDRLFDEGDAVSDMEARQAIYHRIQEIMAEDAAILPLLSWIGLIPYSDRVSGVHFDNNDPEALEQGLNRFTLTKIEE